jgi:hypothetical protein
MSNSSEKADKVRVDCSACVGTVCQGTGVTRILRFRIMEAVKELGVPPC